MKNTLRNFWESRPPQERRVIVVLAAVFGIALYLLLLQTAHRARKQLGPAVFQLRAEALRLDKSADEIARLRAMPAIVPPETNLRQLMQAQVDSAGLARSLERIDSGDASQIKVVFGAVPFADWLAWVVTLQKQQIRLESSRVEALSTPGLVSATATFIRPKL